MRSSQIQILIEPILNWVARESSVGLRNRDFLHDQSLHSFGREYQCNLPTEIASSNICGNS